MSFKTNHNDMPEEQLMPAGDYEVVISDIHEDATKSGTPYVRIHVVVRNDVEQPYKNKHVFESLWTTAGALVYTQRKLNAIDAALDMPEMEYESINAWGALLKHKPMRVHVGIKPAQGDYPAKNTIDGFKKTTCPDCRHVWPTADTSTAQTAAKTAYTAVNDDELPF